MTAGDWDPAALAALVWAKRLLAVRDVTGPPSARLWQATLARPDATLAALRAHRLEAAAGRSLAALGPLPAPLDRALRAADRTHGLQSLAHLSVARRMQQALADAGIPALFVKGVFQSQQSTGDPLFRGAGDVDVLVAPESFDRVVDLMTGQLQARHVPYQALPQLLARVARVHHATTLYVGHTHIDLHHRLDPEDHLMGGSFTDVWRARERVEIRGHSFDTLASVDAAVFVASHGCQDNWPRMRHVMDFALALDVAVRRAGFAAVRRRAHELGVGHRFAIAVQVAKLLVPDLPDQGPRARAMARWAWSRHRAGRDTQWSGSTRDAIATFAYWTLSEGDPRSLVYAARRLAWLPSAMGDAGLPERLWWAYPVLAPVNVTRRLVHRSRAGSS